MNAAGIEAFLAIMQVHSLNKAAERLNVTQATVSYRLKMLEEEMGGTLIARSKGTHTIELTPFGENFAVIAERWRILKQDTEVLQAVGPQLRLTIGGSNSLNTYVLPPLYTALMQHVPRLSLRFRTQHSTELYDTLERREIDVAFVKMKKNLPNITVEPFFVDTMVLIRYAAPENKASDILDPASLQRKDEMYMNWGPAYEAWHNTWWDPLDHTYIPVDTAGLIYSLLCNAKQWAVVPQSTARAFVKSGRFVIQKLSDPPPARICYKATHIHLSAATRSALEILNHYMERIKEPLSQ